MSLFIGKYKSNVVPASCPVFLVIITFATVVNVVIVNLQTSINNAKCMFEGDSVSHTMYF